MQNLNAKTLEALFSAVGDHLQASKQTAAIVVVGGAAMSLRGWVRRSTQDVDVIAMARTSGATVTLVPPDFPDELRSAVARVARDFNLAADWLNSVVGAQWRTGIPQDADQDIEWREYGGLRVGLAGRLTLITLKLFAAVDHGPRSVHVQDLIALAPTDHELSKAGEWVVEQDVGPGFAAMVSEVINHVSSRR